MITLGSCSEVCLCTGWKWVNVWVHCRLVWEERLFGWCRVWLDGSHHEYTGELSLYLCCCILLPRMTVSRMQRLVIGCRPYLLLIWLELRTWQLSREHFQVQNPDVTSPSGRGRHQTGKDAGKGTPAWSESKPSGIDILGGTGRLTNAHPSVQVHRWEQCDAFDSLWHWWHFRGSTNMDLSRDDEGATQDRSNAPITTTNDPEQVRWLIE